MLPTFDAEAVVAQLIRRGFVASNEGVVTRPLTGGVSNDVFAVTGPGLDVVVKRALGQLRVQEDWFADPGRIDTEGRALRLAGELQPHAVPAVLDLADGYLVIDRAPDDWHTWKEDLLTGTVDSGVAEYLGRALGVWQRQTAGRPNVAVDFGDITAFRQLRVEPFHHTIAERNPELAEIVERTVAVMADSRVCLVHGDYTPKNVLVDPSDLQVWIIDWEVAHVGDPTFDPAWMLGHLLLKTIHQPRSATSLATAGKAFLKALIDELAGAIVLDPAQLVRQTGCLLLARVDGKSPAEYLTSTQKDVTRNLARQLLINPPATPLDAWEMLA